jgi:hypothetical protein
MCLGVKGKHTLLCWTCHNDEGGANDGRYSTTTEQAIAEFNAMLSNEKDSVVVVPRV